MGAIVVVLLLALVLAAADHLVRRLSLPWRGDPALPALGEAMRRGVESLPTLDPEQQDRGARAWGGDRCTPTAERCAAHV